MGAQGALGKGVKLITGERLAQYLSLIYPKQHAYKRDALREVFMRIHVNMLRAGPKTRSAFRLEVECLEPKRRERIWVKVYATI